MLAVTKGAIYICMSSSELHTLQKAFREAGGHWSTFVIWAKNTFTMGRSDYQRQYEPILYGWKEGTDHFWCGARDQGDVWFIKKPHVNDLHPTMKPVELVERAIRNSSKSRDTVLDPFGGSGTTLIACEKTGRQARLIELEPKYCDVIIRRWQEFSGKEATLGWRWPDLRRRCGGASPSGSVNRTLPPGDCGQSSRDTRRATRTSMGLCLALSDWSAELRILEGHPWKIKSLQIPDSGDRPHLRVDWRLRRPAEPGAAGRGAQGTGGVGEPDLHPDQRHVRAVWGVSPARRELSTRGWNRWWRRSGTETPPVV